MNIVFPLFIRYYNSMIKEYLYIELFFPLTFLTSKTEINSYKKKGFTFKEKKYPMEVFSSFLRSVLFGHWIKCIVGIVFSHKIPWNKVKLINSHSFLNSTSKADLHKPQNTATPVPRSLNRTMFHINPCIDVYSSMRLEI